ncbi:hypothetical protein R0K18_15230 [Pantoea sp. SIMBA_133]
MWKNSKNAAYRTYELAVILLLAALTSGCSAGTTYKLIDLKQKNDIHPRDTAVPSFYSPVSK